MYLHFKYVRLMQLRISPLHHALYLCYAIHSVTTQTAGDSAIIFENFYHCFCVVYVQR